MTKTIILIVLTIFISCETAEADEPFWDELARYFQRIDTVTVASGDARNVNAVTHIIDPWPHYVGNRRIPANGQRMVSAIRRYRNPTRPGFAPAPTLVPVIMPQVTGVGAGAGGGGAAGGASGGGSEGGNY